MGVSRSGCDFDWCPVHEPGRRSAGRKRLWWRLAVVAVAVVVPVAAIIGPPSAAFAAGLSPGALDTAGNATECSVHYTQYTLGSAGYSQGESDMALPGLYSDINNYLSVMTYSFYCNTNEGSDPGTSGTIAQSVMPALPSVSCFTAGASCHSYADGHATGSMPGYSVGLDVCVSTAAESLSDWASFTAWWGWQSPLCGPWQCQVGASPCNVGSAVPASGMPSEPGVYWGTESAVIPGVQAPTVICTVTLNVTTGVAAFTGSGTANPGDTGDTLSYLWDFGDGTTATVTNVNHTYTAGSEPSGGWNPVLTVTATGDGVHSSGTDTGTCTKQVSLVTGSGPGGSGGTSTAPPTSCGWTDFLCDIEAAVAWLLVPDSSFTAAWSGFVSDIETKVPFGYVAGSVSWVYTWTQNSTDYANGNAVHCWNLTLESSGTECVVMPSGGGSGGATLIGMFRDGILAVFVLGIVVGVVAETRRIIRSH
jgi:hypothetical protein